MTIEFSDDLPSLPIFQCFGSFLIVLRTLADSPRTLEAVTGKLGEQYSLAAERSRRPVTLRGEGRMMGARRRAESGALTPMCVLALELVIGAASSVREP